MPNTSRPDLYPNFSLFSLPPPPPPPITTTTTIAATTATVAIATKVLFWDDTVELFKLNFYVDLGLLKTIHSYLENKTELFKLILFTTSYLHEDSLKYKVESLLKNIKNINNAVVRRLSEKAIKSNNKVRAFISALQECTIVSLENINDTNKHYFELKLCRELQLIKYRGKKIGIKVDRE
jgi:hypothetical protein